MVETFVFTVILIMRAPQLHAVVTINYTVKQSGNKFSQTFVHFE